MEKVRSSKYLKQIFSLDYDDSQIPSSRRLDFERVHELFKTGDYYRSKEALGAEFLRMVSLFSDRC